MRRAGTDLAGEEDAPVDTGRAQSPHEEERPVLTKIIGAEKSGRVAAVL